MKIFISVFAFLIPLAVCSQNNRIKVYFNNPVEHSVSTGQHAEHLYYTMDDTLIAYINRAKYELDIAIYSWNNAGISDISSAVNNAYNRGVKVRVISDSSSNPVGLQSLDPNIHRITRPIGNGIMHNKFVIIDANSPNPFDSFVWTGSTNFTAKQMNSDPNNVIIFQDQTLAKAFQIEFEEMWGDTGLVPNKANAKFGPAKTDNIPHIFNVGGTMVELYFSPSDGVNSKIINAINSADNDLQFATMLITRNDIASAITAGVSLGVYSLGLVDDSSSTTTWATLRAGMWDGTLIDYSPSTGIMHHKYLIVDHSNPFSDPLVLTGSHNWSTSAETVNDENTVIIHDATITNLYYQEFVKRFQTNGGAYDINDIYATEPFKVYPNPAYKKVRCAINNNYLNSLLSIYDVFGKKKFESEIPHYEFEISVHHFTPGIYFLELKKQHLSARQKLIIR